MKIIPMTEIFCDIDDFYREFKDNIPKIFGSSSVLVEPNADVYRLGTLHFL